MLSPGTPFTTRDTEAHVGDTMGCGIVFDPEVHEECRQPQMVLVYFTLRGNIIYKKIRWLPEGGFYPTVGLYPIGHCYETLPTDVFSML